MPNALTTARIARGLIADTLSQSRPIALSVSAGRLATTTSADPHQPLHDFAPGIAHWIEGKALLVAVHLQEHRAFARATVFVFRQRNEGAVLAAVAFLHPDHFGAEIAQQRRAERARDITTEIDHTHVIKRSRHGRTSLLC